MMDKVPTKMMGPIENGGPKNSTNLVALSSISSIPTFRKHAPVTRQINSPLPASSRVLRPMDSFPIRRRINSSLTTPRFVNPKRQNVENQPPTTRNSLQSSTVQKSGAKSLVCPETDINTSNSTKPGFRQNVNLGADGNTSNLAKSTIRPYVNSLASSSTMRSNKSGPKTISEAVLQLSKAFFDTKMGGKDRANLLFILSQWCEAQPSRSIELLTSFHAHCKTQNGLKNMSKTVLDIIAVPLAEFVAMSNTSPEAIGALPNVEAHIARSLLRILNSLFAGCDSDKREMSIWMIQVQMIGLHDSVLSLPSVCPSDFPKLLTECNNYKEHYGETLKWSLSNGDEVYAQFLLYILTLKRFKLNDMNVSSFSKNLYLASQTDNDVGSFGTLFDCLQRSLQFYILPESSDVREIALPKFLKRWNQIFTPEVENITHKLSSSKTSLLSSCDSPYSSLTSSASAVEDCVDKPKVHSNLSTPLPNTPEPADIIPDQQVAPPPAPPPPPPPSFSVPSCPPPPPLPPLGSIPPPPPPMQLNCSKESFANPFNSSNLLSSSIWEPIDSLRKSSTGKKWKTLNWKKTDTIKIQTTDNIWQSITNQLSSELKPTNDKLGSLIIDFNELEEFFSTPSKNDDRKMPIQRRVSVSLSSIMTDKDASPVMNSSFCDDSTLDQENESVSLGFVDNSSVKAPTKSFLSSQRSFTLNVFLATQKEDIIKVIDECELNSDSSFGLDSLQSFRSLLPTEEEFIRIENFRKEDENFVDQLPDGERFLYNFITKVANYQLKIDFILLRDEFSTNVPKFDSEIENIRNATQELMSSDKMRDVFGLILVSGNFLNSGMKYAQHAFGFQLSSLNNIRGVRASNDCSAYFTLLHYIVSQAEKKKIADFAEELPTLEKASKISIENLQSEIKTLMFKIDSLKRNSHENYSKITLFLSEAENTSKRLRKFIGSELEELRLKVAQFFCEKNQEFKLEECFQILASFVAQFRVASADNERNERKRKNEERRMTRSVDFQGPSPFKRWASLRGPRSERKFTDDSALKDDLERAILTELDPERGTITNGNISGSNIRRVNSLKHKTSQISITDESDLRDLKDGGNLYLFRNSRLRRSLESSHSYHKKNINGFHSFEDNNVTKNERFKSFVQNTINNRTEELADELNKNFNLSKENAHENEIDSTIRPATLSMNSEIVEAVPTSHLVNQKPESQTDEHKKKISQGLMVPLPFLRKGCGTDPSKLILSPIDEICASKQFFSRL